MDENTAPETNNSGISRKRFFTSAGMAIVGGAVVTDKALGRNASEISPLIETGCLSASYTGTLDAAGLLEVQHGLGADLPKNVLSVGAFIDLPGGRVRNISVQYVDDTVISIAGGVPAASVRISVVYSRDNSSQNS